MDSTNDSLAIRLPAPGDLVLLDGNGTPCLADVLAIKDAALIVQVQGGAEVAVAPSTIIQIMTTDYFE